VSTDPIRRLVGKYGTSILLDAPSDSARPLYTSTGLGGRPGATFDNSNDYWASTFSMATGAKWFCAELACTSNPSNKLLVACQEAGAASRWDVRLFNATTIQFGCGIVAAGANRANITIPSIGTGRHTFLFTWDGVDPTTGYAAWWDGVSTATGVSSLAAPAGSVGLWIGSYYGSASHSPPATLGRMASGYGALSAGEITNLHTWMGA
jgi:hypothetical protein